MEALQKTEPTVYNEVGLPQLLYHDSNMFQARWVLASECSIKKELYQNPQNKKM
jgi:hypothetical protein